MMRSLALVLVVLFLVLQSGISEPSRVSIVRPSRFVQEHQYLRWMIQVDPHNENRLLIVSAVDADGPVRSTKTQLDGEDAPRTRWIVWQHGLPAGEYTLIAAVFNSSKEVARASVPVTVMARY